MRGKRTNDTIVNGVCSGENIHKKGKKILLYDNYDEPGIYEEFRPLSGPGSSYKPWIYGR